MSMKTKISRRRFLVLAGTAAAAGTAALACGGLTALGKQQPEIEFVETSCGTESGVRGKVLVAYDSQYGSTGGVANAMAQVFCEAGMAVDVKRVTNVDDLSEYRAVVVGAPVHNDAWKPEAISFVEKNRDQLSRIPVAYFLTCMRLGVEPQPESKKRMARVLELVREQVPEVVPVDEGLFAGTVPLGYLSPAIRGVYYVLGQQDGFQGIDFRDWDAIRGWAEELCPTLLDA